MTYEYDFLAFIGRFRPFHNGHKKVLDIALKKAKHVLLLLGSAYRPRTFRDPWTVEEVEEMVKSCYSAADLQRITFLPIRDFLYNDGAWTTNVQAVVNGVVAAKFEAVHQGARIGLIGHEKDGTSYYLKLFPQWASVGVPNHRELNATDIREDFFMNNNIQPFTVPLEVETWLKRWADINPDLYRNIRDEEEFCRSYKRQWADAPYAPIFHTVDAVVIQSAHILLVERKARPGKGLLALPGGFLRSDETLINGCIRELREETKLKVPVPVLKGSIRDQDVFDYPKRSARGRTITYAYYFQLRAEMSLPKVKGSDDAAKAFWLPLSQLDSRQMFEDHYFIIQRFIKTLG